MIEYSKKGWDIVSDIVRYIGSNPGEFLALETDIVHKDLANIIDYMCQGKYFKTALKLYKKEGKGNASWIDNILDELGVEY